MSHTKAGFGPKPPAFFPFDAPDATRGMYDGRPTNPKIRPSLSPRVPSKLRSNSEPSSRKAGGRRNTNANRRNGGGGMYWSPREGLGQ